MKHLAAVLLAASPALAGDLKSDGAFGFPQKDATVLCDTPALRLAVASDRQYLFVQAVLWTDNDPANGLTDDGRDIGDWSNLVIDADADGKVTAKVDRSYALSPWPKLPGLHYAVELGEGMSTGLQSDSKGRGSIQYVDHAGGKVRVDSFLIPIDEVAKPGSTIRVAFWASSPTPSLTLNSVGYESTKRYYSHSLPHDKFHALALSDREPFLDTQTLPDGRSTIKLQAAAAPPKVGSVPPPVAAEAWLNWTGKEPPTLESLKGKVVVVEFWATWCGPCVAGIPHLNKIHDEYGPKGLVLLSLTDQATEPVTKFVKDRDMRYVIGTRSQTIRAYGVTGIPHAFIIGRDGTIVWAGHPADPAFDETIAKLMKAGA